MIEPDTNFFQIGFDYFSETNSTDSGNHSPKSSSSEVFFYINLILFKHIFSSNLC